MGHVKLENLKPLHSVDPRARSLDQEASEYLIAFQDAEFKALNGKDHVDARHKAVLYLVIILTLI